METLDSPAVNADRLPHPTDGDRQAVVAPRRLSHRARRREQRQAAHRERYGPLDFAHDVLDMTLDVLFFWR